MIEPRAKMKLVLRSVRQWHDNTIRSGHGQVRLMQSLCRFSAPACQRLYVATSAWIDEQAKDGSGAPSCPYCGTPLEKTQD